MDHDDKETIDRARKAAADTAELRRQRTLTALSMNDVLSERLRQTELWGIQRHDLGKWLAILTEEVGEFAQAIQPLLGLKSGKTTDAENAYEEIIQVSAVALAIAEQIRESWGK